MALQSQHITWEALLDVVNPLIAAVTDQGLYPQVAAYPEAERKEHRERLTALNAAWGKAQQTKSGGERARQKTLLLRELNWFASAGVGLVAEYGHVRDHELLTSFTLLRTRDEERDGRTWEVQFQISEVQYDLARHRKQLKQKMEWLRDDLLRDLAALSQDDASSVSLTSFAVRGQEIETLRLQIAADEQRLATVQRMAKIVKAADAPAVGATAAPTAPSQGAEAPVETASPA